MITNYSQSIKDAVSGGWDIAFEIAKPPYIIIGAFVLVALVIIGFILLIKRR